MTFDGKSSAEFEDVERGDEEETVAFLSSQANGGSALELGIGVGRIALRLAARGIHVEGIDFATAMIDRLRAKPGGEKIPVVIGNFVDVPVSNKYQLIYIVFNTFFNLLSQDEQVRCFENVAAHLTDDGSFVIEVFVPSFLYRFDTQQHVNAEAIGVDKVQLDIVRHNSAKQLIEESHVVLTCSGVNSFEVFLSKSVALYKKAEYQNSEMEYRLIAMK